MITSLDRTVPLCVALDAVIHVTRWMGHVLHVDLVGLEASVTMVSLFSSDIFKYNHI